MDPWIAAAVFLATYALIATERADRTVVALLGGVLMIVLGVVDQGDAFAAVDLNVILLLASMMVIAGILRGTGFFQWVAIRAVGLSRGSPLMLLIALAMVTAVLSAFLDNVTTVVLVAPVTLYVAAAIGASPMPFLLSQILASNIGGAATLIGDPPNILIGSAAGLGFDAFILNVAPVVLVVFVVFLWMMRREFGPDLAGHTTGEPLLEALDAEQVIEDPGLLGRSLVVLGATIVGFFVGAAFGLEPATIALAGATALLLVSRADPAVALREVEWPTIAFFVGLFILVEGVVAAGLVEAAAEWLVRETSGDQALTTIGLLWLSGVASAIVDNIPYTATTIPVVHALEAAGMRADPLWWALSLGACLGGNATIVGASANVVTAGMAARAGHPIGFRMFARYGIPVVLMSLAISSGYLWLRYLR